MVRTGDILKVKYEKHPYNGQMMSQKPFQLIVNFATLKMLYVAMCVQVTLHEILEVMNFPLEINISYFGCT